MTWSASPRSSTTSPPARVPACGKK